MIKRKIAGPPKRLAFKLNISERQLYKDLELMKDFGLPITYSYEIDSYEYDGEIEFFFGFKNKLKNKWIYGGKK